MDWKEVEDPETVFLVERLLRKDPEVGQGALRIIERRWVLGPPEHGAGICLEEARKCA